MNKLEAFLTPALVIAITFILLVALCSFVFWFWRAKKSIINDLKILNSILGKKDKNWVDVQDEIYKSLHSGASVIQAWQETKNRTIKLPDEKEGRYLIYGVPRDLWNAHSLLSRQFNIGLAEAMPNILVGFGLFFTFLFLSWALIDATAALTEASSSIQTESAISELLKTAGSKFWTSLIGLLASILWTFGFRLSLNEINKECEKILKLLRVMIPPDAGETIAKKQLILSQGKFESSSDQKDLILELLEESREQTGTFKRFETDLAVSLASAINQAFTPQMQDMTERLVASIEGLSEKLGSMNEEAIRTMLTDFSAMLKKATDSEMEQLKQTLQELTNQLHGAGSVLETQSGVAAKAILNAGSGIQEQLKEAGNILGAQTVEIAEVVKNAGMVLAEQSQNISEKLVQGAAEFEQAVSSIKLGIKDLDDLVQNASAAGTEGITKVHAILENADSTVAQLYKASSGLIETSQSLEETGTLVTSIVNNVQELAQEQRAVVISVKEVVPNAMEAVSRVTEVLDQAAAQNLASMQQTRQSMEITAVTLGKTVGSITEGVSVYSEQVAELHRQMDGQLAKAVGSFDQGVKDLAEIVEELVENFQSENKTTKRQ